MSKAAVVIIFIALCRGQAPEARVTGVVTNLGGEPIRRATVYLDQGAQVYTAESGAQGNFVLEGIPPGRYTLSTERTGYIRFWQPTLVVLDPGQSMTGISIKMTPQGIIAGKVSDEEGEPFPNATIKVYRSIRGRDGLKQLAPFFPNVTADADGAFVIGNLPPATYYVSATESRGTHMQMPHRSGEVAYVTTYYPDANTASDGSPITVTAGGQNRSVEIHMRRVPVFRITGKVVSAATGQPASNPTINLIAKGQLQGSGEMPVKAAVLDGAFEFDQVLPGAYLLQATPDGMSGDTILVGRQEIIVKRGDVEDVLLPITPAAEVAGRVVVESAPGSVTMSSLNKISVTLTASDGIYYFPPAQVDDDGSFLIRGIEPDSYRVSLSSPFLGISNLPPNMYLKAIRLAGRDVTGKPIDLSGGSAGQIEIVLSPNAAKVTGIVHDPAGAPLCGAWVELWHSGQGQPDPQIVRSACDHGSDDGGFLIASLKPGEYKVLAVAASQFVTGDEYDWMARFEDRAVTVKLDEGSQTVADPPVVILN